MTELSPLIAVLSASFDWHGARITFVAQFMLALIRVRTVNFAEIATAFCGEAKVDSNYRRIQRFFKDFSLSRAPGGSLCRAPAPTRGKMDPVSRPNQLEIWGHEH